MVGEVRRHRLAGLGASQPLRDAQVHEPAARVREVRVDGATHDIVGERIGARLLVATPGCAQEGVALEQVEGTEQPVEIEGHQLAEPLDGERAPEHGRPAEHVPRLGRQPLDTVPDERREGTRQRSLATRERPHHLEREERVPSALREHPVGVDAGSRGVDELGRLPGTQGGERDLLERARLAQAEERATHRLVVDELAVAGGERDEQGAVAAHPGHVVEQLGGGGVEPLHVVEGEHERRGARGALGDELQHRTEQAVAAHGSGEIARELGQERPEVVPQPVADLPGSELPQRVDPGAEGPSGLSLEGTPLEEGSAALTGPLPQLGEETRLAEPWRTGQEQHLLPPLACGVVEGLLEPRALGATAHERRRPMAVGVRRGRGGAGGFPRARRPDTARAPCPLERFRHLAAELLPQPTGRLVLLFGLAPSTGGRQHANEARAGLLVERVDGGERSRVRQSRLGGLGQATDEGAQEARVELPGLLALRHAPGLEVEEVAEVESLEELSPELPRERGQLLDRHAVQPGGEALLQGEDVDPGTRGLEGHAVARSEDPRSFGLVHERPEPAQAPPQGAARVVGHVPEKATEAIAAVGPAAQGEVCQ